MRIPRHKPNKKWLSVEDWPSVSSWFLCGIRSKLWLCVNWWGVLKTNLSNVDASRVGSSSTGDNAGFYQLQTSLTWQPLHVPLRSLTAGNTADGHAQQLYYEPIPTLFLKNYYFSMDYFPALLRYNCYITLYKVYTWFDTMYITKWLHNKVS